MNKKTVGKAIAVIAIAGVTGGASAVDLHVGTGESMSSPAASSLRSALDGGASVVSTFTDIFNFSLASAGTVSAKAFRFSAVTRPLALTSIGLYGIGGLLGNSFDSVSMPRGQGDDFFWVGGTAGQRSTDQVMGVAAVPAHVPEPSSVLMLLAGVGVVGRSVARRRRQG